MSDFRITINGRKVTIHGIEMGDQTLLDLKFKATKDPTLKGVWAHIKVAGRSYWSGIGQPRNYAPGHIIIVQVHHPKIEAGPPKHLWQLTGMVNYPFDHEVYPKASDNSIVEVMKRLQELQ